MSGVLWAPGILSPSRSSLFSDPLGVTDPSGLLLGCTLWLDLDPEPWSSCSDLARPLLPQGQTLMTLLQVLLQSE